MQLSKAESRSRKKYFAEAHIKKDVQLELDAVIKNSSFTYKGLLKQFRLQKAIEIVKKSEINIATGKVYFDGQEVSGIYEFTLDAFNELSSAADQASQNFSELGNIQKTL